MREARTCCNATYGCDLPAAARLVWSAGLIRLVDQIRNSFCAPMSLPFVSEPRDAVHARMDVFRCFFVCNIVKEKKRKSLQKCASKKKSPDLFDQYNSMAERETD